MHMGLARELRTAPGLPIACEWAGEGDVEAGGVRLPCSVIFLRPSVSEPGPCAQHLPNEQGQDSGRSRGTGDRIVVPRKIKPPSSTQHSADRAVVLAVVENEGNIWLPRLSRHRTVTRAGRAVHVGSSGPGFRRRPAALRAFGTLSDIFVSPPLFLSSLKSVFALSFPV